MREIKFRAWDKKTNEWLFGYEMQNLGGFSMFGEVMMMGEYAQLLSSYFPDRLEDIALMQFTGLHDRNGKEIYEGDIVKVKTGASIANGAEFRSGAIKWSDFCMGWAISGVSIGQMATFGMPFEVIGNIYENPELIST